MLFPLASFFTLTTFSFQWLSTAVQENAFMLNAIKASSLQRLSKAPLIYLSSNSAKASRNIYPVERHPTLKSHTALTSRQREKTSLLCSRLASLNWKLKTLPEMQEVCSTPRRKTNKMSSSLTAFGSRVTKTRSTYMLGPQDNKRCLTSRTLSHNSDGLEHNRSWQGHERGGGWLVCRPPGRRRLLSGVGLAEPPEPPWQHTPF